MKGMKKAMSTRSRDIGGGGTSTTATEGAGTDTTSSATAPGGSATGTSAGAGEGSGSVVQSNTPADAPPNAPQSATPAFAKPGEGQLQNVGASDAQAQQPAQAGQTSGLVGYPLRLTVDGHIHAGVPYKKGQTIALDAAEYRWAIQNKIGEPGNKEDVGLDIDDAGNVIKPTAPTVIPLPEDQAIQPGELSASGRLKTVEDAAKPATEPGTTETAKQ
jgi:hypothetical protein